MVCQSFLVALFDSRPFVPERFVFGEWQKSLELVKVLKPYTLVNLEGLRDESAELGVTLSTAEIRIKLARHYLVAHLVEPPPRSNAIGNIAESI
jgi:hypothetical protein